MADDASVSSEQMRQWRDCRTTEERRRAVIEAMRVARNVKSHAAKLLGLSRQHFHRVWDSGPDAVTTVTPTDGVTPRVMRQRTAAVAPFGGVAPTNKDSLTYGRSAPTLQPVPTETLEATDVVRVAFDLPKPINDWLEQKALERKQRGQSSRMAKSPIVVELIEREMNGTARQTAATRRPGRKGSDK